MHIQSSLANSQLRYTASRAKDGPDDVPPEFPERQTEPGPDDVYDPDFGRRGGGSSDYGGHFDEGGGSGGWVLF